MNFLSLFTSRRTQATSVLLFTPLALPNAFADAAEPAREKPESILFSFDDESLEV